MGKKIRGVKLKIQDVNKNTGKNISHTISKIQDNERKYTFILVIFFMLLFFVIGYLSLKAKNTNFFNYSNNINGAYLSLSSKVVFLGEKNKISDNNGLLSDGIDISFYNTTDEDINYKLILVDDTDLGILCGCKNEMFDKNYIRFSIDGVNVKRFFNNEMVITTGYLEMGKTANINLKMWQDINSLNTGHFHGKVIFEKMED